MIDPIEIMRRMAAHKIRFVVIGGIAGRYWGSPTVTEDIDVFMTRESESLHQLVIFLSSINARSRDGDDVEIPWSVELISKMDTLTLITDFGALDILFNPAGALSFETVESDAEREDIEGESVLFCSLDDLILMKQAADRDKDRIEVEILKAVRDERSD